MFMIVVIKTSGWEKSNFLFVFLYKDSSASTNILIH